MPTQINERTINNEAEDSNTAFVAVDEQSSMDTGSVSTSLWHMFDYPSSLSSSASSNEAAMSSSVDSDSVMQIIATATNQLLVAAAEQQQQQQHHQDIIANHFLDSETVLSEGSGENDEDEDEEVDNSSCSDADDYDDGSLEPVDNCDVWSFFLKNRLDTDFALLVEGRRLYVNAFCIFKASKYLSRLDKKGLLSKRMYAMDSDVNMIEAMDMLKHIYPCYHLELTEFNIKSMLKLAKRYEIASLYYRCRDEIVDYVRYAKGVAEISSNNTAASLAVENFITAVVESANDAGTSLQPIQDPPNIYTGSDHSSAVVASENLGVGGHYGASGEQICLGDTKVSIHSFQFNMLFELFEYFWKTEDPNSQILKLIRGVILKFKLDQIERLAGFRQMSYGCRSVLLSYLPECNAVNGK